jgi:MoaA/NifB/PqqE/SkfB family radical SAM enzyme
VAELPRLTTIARKRLLARLHELADPYRRVIDISNANGAPGRVRKAGAVAPRPNEPVARIPSVDWWITSGCNLRCDFCYGPERVKDPVRRRDKILQALAESSARVVTFCGGEPLMVGRIDTYAGTLARAGKSAVLNTNGQLLGRRLAPRPGKPGFLLANFALVGISIDGSTPEIHRAMRGEKARLDEVVAAARLIAREPGVRLKLATVVSSVNRDDLPGLAAIVRDLDPSIWRLYQYSSRGKVNTGQQRHRLADDEFRRLAELAADLAAPVPVVSSSEAETEGCLIVDPAGNVLQPKGNAYVRHGNCLDEPLDRIWAGIRTRSAIISNKRWLSVLDQQASVMTT